jgi:hypothetical protein
MLGKHPPLHDGMLPVHLRHNDGSVCQYSQLVMVLLLSLLLLLLQG